VKELFFHLVELLGMEIILYLAPGIYDDSSREFTVTPLN